MEYHTFIWGLRLFDAIIAALVFGLLVHQGRYYWPRYSDGQKWMYSSFTTYTLAVCYTSFELWAQDVDTGLRSYIVLIANTMALYALWRYKNWIMLDQGDDQQPSLPPR